MTARRIAKRTASNGLVIVVVLMAALAVPLATSAQSFTYDLSGRWTSAALGYALDVGQCGEEWCGVRLKADQSCGAMVLRLQQKSQVGAFVMLTGHLDLGPEIKPYELTVIVDNTGGASPAELKLMGNPDAPPPMLSMHVEFDDKIARSGDAQCKIDP